MKALKHKISREWLSDIDSWGIPYTGNIPKEVGEAMQSIQQIEEAENAFRPIARQVNLSDYELVEIVIVEKADHDKLIDLAWAYKQLTEQ